MGHREKDELANLNAKTARAKPALDCIAWLKSKDVPVTAIETPGGHTWMVWRDNLVHFAPLLFQKR